MEEHKNNVYSSIREYIYDNKWKFVLGAFILLLIYGKNLYPINPRVDTEFLINDPKGFVNWLGIGRQGGIFTRILFEQLNFNPYFASILAFIVYIISMILFTYLLYYIGKVDSKISIFGFVVFLVHPIWMEQFYFTMQILEVAVGMLLIITSVFFMYYSIIHERKITQILIIPLMIWGFATYQTFVILYISLVILCFILLYRNKAIQNFKSSIKIIVNIICLFLIAFIINEIITKIFFSSSADYLNQQIQWGKIPINMCIKNILGNIYDVITGKGIFYTYGFIVSFILSIAGIIYNILKKRIEGCRGLYVLAYIGLQACPFLLTVYGGIAPAFRSQYILPFVIASNLILAFVSFQNISSAYKTIYVISAIILIFQAQTVLRLEYTEEIRFQQDKILATQISQNIYEVANRDDKKVAFIGNINTKLNPTCIEGELIGKSIFDWDGWIKPYYYKSSNRIVDLCNTMGFNMKNVSLEQMVEARKIAKDMPVWPAKGSVKDNGDFVIVKLSGDSWYGDDLMQPKTNKVQIDNLKFDNDRFIGYVDTIQVEKDNIVINGWIMKPKISSRYSQVTVYLVNKDNTQIYELATSEVYRNDITKIFNNEEDYDHCGYIAKGKVSQLEGDLSDYRVVLKYINGDEESYVDTERYIY